MAKNFKLISLPFDRVSARLSLLMAAFVPLFAVALTHYFTTSSKSSRDSATTSLKSHQRLVEFCSKNVKNNRAFVVFQHGTCVVVENQSDTASIKKTALGLLKTTAKPGARFVCTPVEDDHIIVSYTEPVFHLRFQEDMSRHNVDIENDYRRFLTKEELADISPHWDPPFHAKVGLRSRARLLKDAAQPAIAHIIAPRGTEKTSAGETASVSF